MALAFRALHLDLISSMIALACKANHLEKEKKATFEIKLNILLSHSLPINEKQGMILFQGTIAVGQHAVVYSG